MDTSAIIYAVERIEPYYFAALPLWDALDAGQQQVSTSDLTLLEVLVKPLRDGDTALAALYRSVLLGTAGLTCWPITRPLLERAASIRAGCALRTPDAIQAATAAETGCTLLVTTDPDFRRVPGLTVVVLSEIAAA